MPYSGSCFCGAVKYRLEDKPIFVNCCHCTDCRKQTGGAFAINAVIETANVTVLSGQPVATRMYTDSGAPHDIFRCPECQTALWSDYGYGVLLFVRVATLDDAAAFPPDAHIWVRSKLPWVALPEGVPAFDEFYDKEKLYSPESLKRRYAATGGK
jgi:hypothetical protein